MRFSLYAFVVFLSLFPIIFAQESEQPSDIDNSRLEENNGNDQAKNDKEQAPTNDVPWQLDERLITPTKTEETQFKQPYNAYVISKKQLQEHMVRSLPEALRTIPGVMVQKTANGHGSPYIRGFTGFRTLLLIDGIRLNNSVFREGPNQYWNTVDYLSIERLEVVKGPASTLYGSDAIGGTVNAIPRKRNNYEQEWQINPRAYYRFASAGRSHTSRLEVSANYGENFGVLGGFFYKQFGDVQAGRDTGLMPRTGYYELGGDIHINVFLSENMELELAYYDLDQNNVWRTHKTIFSKSFHGTTVGNELRRLSDQDHKLGYFRLSFYDLPAIQKLSITTSWQYQREERDRVRANLRRDIQGFSVNTLGLQVQASSESKIGLWSYGVEYYRDFVNSFRKDYNRDGSLKARRIQGPVADNASYDIVGIYLQNELTLFESLTLTSGIRYTHAWVDANKVQDPLNGEKIGLSDNWGQLTGNFRFSLELQSHWRVFAGISQGFRTPNLSDITRFDTARSNEIETPVRSLDPENFLQYEAGIKANYENCYFQGSFYYTQIFNMIIRYPTGNIINGNSEVTKGNEGNGFVYGVELTSGYYITPDWLVFTGFSWMEGLVSTFPNSNSGKKDEVIDRLPPASGYIGIHWTASKNYWAEGRVNMARSQQRLSSRDMADTQRIPPGGTPGYATVELRAGAKIFDNIDISASLENIGNKDYRVHGSGQNEPGLNAILAVDIGL